MAETTLWKSWTRAAVAALLWAVSLAALAQTYAYRNDVFSYDTPSGSANVVTWHTTTASACSGFPDGDDDYADITFSAATSPANDFTFTFAGVARTGLRIYSNGMLAFGNDVSGFWRTYTNATLPVSSAVGAYSASCPGGIPSNIIAAYWTDIVAGTANATSGASVQYELLGTKPNRRFVISWVNVKLYNTATRYNFQIILYESPAGGLNSNFKYQYTTGSSTGSAATVGVQVSAADYTLYSFNRSFIDPIAGSAILWYPANQLQGKQAEYRFDEGLWNGTANEVQDTSTGLYDGVRVGAAINTSSGKVCRGGSFTANTSNATIDAVATPIAPASAGSIDFWYNSNAKWNAASSDAMLFDATAAAAKPFFLSKTASGILNFAVTDSSGTVLTVASAGQSFAAGTWHHVGVSWNLRPGTNQTVLQIFLDGVLSKSLRTTSSGSITALSTLYIGDNRTSGITPTGGTPNGANGFIDEVNLYNIEINASQALADKNSTRATCLAFDHFHIVHAGSLVNCGGAIANITLEAHDSAHALIALSGTVANLSTNTGHGTWLTVAGGSINPVVDSGGGNGSYTFSNESSVTIGLQNSFTESTNINVAAGIFTEHSGVAASCVAQDYTFGSTCDADLSFVSAGFRFVDSSGNNIAYVDGFGNHVGNQVAGVTSGTYYLQAVKTSCTTPGPCTGICTSVFPAASAVNIDLAFECANPTTCQAGQAVTITPGAGAGAAGAISANNSGAVSSSTGAYTSMSLTFNASSPTVAVPFTLKYPDVGQLRLWARYPAGSTSPTVAGQSATFIVAPHHFTLSGIPAAPLVAGVNFAATVTASNSSNVATPNFGQETTTPAGGESVTLAATMCQPTGTGAALGALTATVGAFSAGATAISNLAWSEVGTIDLAATLTKGNYLGSGLTASGNTGTGGAVCSGGVGNVGRFRPDHFTTTVAPACGGTFTYSGQPLPITVTAMNGAATPLPTKNYDGTSGTTPNFAKAVTLIARNAADTASNPGPGAWVLTGASVPASAFGKAPAFGSPPVAAIAGAAQVNPAYAFGIPQTVPTVVRVRAVDTDGVTSASSTEGNSTEISGRFWLTNAYGSEFLPLPVAMQVQSWSATGWTLNRLDNCTKLTTPTSVSGLSNTLSGSTIATLGSPVAAGDPTFRLSAPGSGGVVDISSTVMLTGIPWLAPTVPSVRACFGLCGPRSPVIYSRERY